MTRLAAALANDVRLQVRYGLYGVSLLMVLIWGLLLGALSRGPMLPPALLVPPFVAINLLITTFYFMAALVLFEKSEAVLPALLTTPLRGVEYLLSKAVSLALLAAAETLLIVAFVFGARAVTLRLLTATILLGVLYALAGFTAVARFDSINTFLMPSVPMATILLVPLLVHFNLAGDLAMAWHPAQPMMMLMRRGGIAAVLAGLVWCGFGLLVARRELQRFVVRA